MIYSQADRQIEMNRFLPGLIDLTVDGIRGPKTMQAESAIAEFFGVKEIPQTDDFYEFISSSSSVISAGMDLRRITALNGERVPCRCSTFGGPLDKGDRTYGQSFIDTFQAETPRAIAEAWIAREYVPRYLFAMQAMMSFTSWPVIDGETMGLSYFLVPDMNYAALRIRTGLVKKAMRNGHMLINVFAPKTNKLETYITVTDYGPRPDTKRAIDISPGVMARLSIKTDDIVYIAWSR